VRCKSCESLLEEDEIIWDEERGGHEELCRLCLEAAGVYEIRREQVDKEAQAIKEEILRAIRSKRM
jgi:hypothetical protein